MQDCQNSDMPDRTTVAATAKPSLVEELRTVWGQLPHRWLFVGLLALWVGFFHFFGNSTLGYIDTRSLFGWVRYVYRNSPDDEHGYLIPFAVLALLWWKRDEWLPLRKEIWWPAFGFVLIGLLLHIVGYVVQQTRISLVGFFLGLYGLTGWVWGRRWLQATFFPMILFAFCIPLGTLADSITVPLRGFVTWISVGVSHNVLGIDVLRDGSQILDFRGKPMYDVAPACSGIRSLTTLTALTIVYGFTTFRAWWKRGLIVLLAVPLAVLGNLLRVTSVIVIGEAFGQNVAAALEQKFGFVTFGFAVGSILLVGWLLQKMEKPTETPPAVAGGVA
jgi:exosortase